MGRLGRRTVAVAGPLRTAHLAGIRALLGVIQLDYAADRRGGVTVQRRSQGSWMSTGMLRQRQDACGSYSRLNVSGWGRSQWFAPPTSAKRCLCY